MRHFLKLKICTAVLVSFFCQFAAAQDSFLPDSNLRRYQSLNYMLTVQEDIESFGGKTVTDESVQEKIADFFEANHIASTRQISASPLPCLIIKVIPQVGVGLVMRPVQICRVYFYVVDRLSGTNAEVWEDGTEGYFVGGGLTNICQEYWNLIDEKLNSFRNAWLSTHSQPAPSEQTKKKVEDDKMPEYVIDKTTNTEHWIVKFNKDIEIEVDPDNVTYNLIAGYSIDLKPGQYIKKENEDGSFSLLKDLDRR